MINKEYYNIECKNGHKSNVSLTELEEICDWGGCPECGAEITFVDADEFEVSCPACSWKEFNDWDSIQGWFIVGCPQCENAGIKTSVSLSGSFYSQVAEYENFIDKVDTSKYKRSGRPDYWEIVIHFCTRDELISILKSKTIVANNTGYYVRHGVKAVCLSEVPVVFSEDIRKVHGNYGIAFRKSSILKYGGQPVIYITDKLIKAQESVGGFSDSIKPFIQLLRIPSISTSPFSKRVDFLHEREWRCSKDIDLDILKPLGLILPRDSDIGKFIGKEWDLLLDKTYEYGEISE